MRLALLGFRILVCLLFSSAFLRAAEARVNSPPIFVILWFDTEDYLLPASDDSAKHLAELLHAKGIRATFKVVGEKARTLERRGRTDVIAALKMHAIAYHSNFHSVHPTPSEYLAQAGFLDGVAEFIRREGGGADDVRRIFGVPTLACYGQPGSSWAAQAIAALKTIHVSPHGVPCYVDDGINVGVNEQPFWYENALMVYDMGQYETRMELHDPSAVGPAKQKVARLGEQLRAPGGGLISIFYHPCEFVHEKFWDGVNFARGANPPREAWKAPPQRPPEQTEAAFQRFSEYIDFIQAMPGVRFITAEDLPVIYPDPLKNRAISDVELRELAEEILRDPRNVGFRRVGDVYWSAADQFEALAQANARSAPGNRPAEIVVKGLFGPDQPARGTAKTLFVPWSAFDKTVLDVDSFIQQERRVPSRVFIGAETVSPAEFLQGLAAAFLQRSKPNQPNANEEGIVLANDSVTLDSEKYIAPDTPDLFGGWIIHKAGFRAPKIVEIARLQAWTLKPAVFVRQNRKE